MDRDQILRFPGGRGPHASSVPYLSRESIEQKAEEVLRWIRPQALITPSLTPVADVAERLMKKHGVLIRVDCDLGYSSRGKKILGICQFRPPVIYLDRVLDPSLPKYRFTLAHELGHLALHRKFRLDPDELDIALNEIRDDRTHIYLGRKQTRTARERLELQANLFAAAFLMPRATLKAAVVERQRELGIRRPGIIYVDFQPANVIAYQQLILHLKGIYRVSRTSLEIRLNDLGILNDRRLGPPRITTLLREA